jgi:hypothetical protein
MKGEYGAGQGGEREKGRKKRAMDGGRRKRRAKNKNQKPRKQNKKKRCVCGLL